MWNPRNKFVHRHAVPVINSKSHLVAQAVSTDYPVIQEDAHRRLSEEQRTLDLASEEERETARTLVSRVTWNLAVLILEE